MANLVELDRTRSVLKGQLTRFRNLVESISDQPESNDRGLLQLPMRLSVAQPLLDKFDNIQTQIESLQVGDDQAESNDQERDSFETTYYIAMQTAKNILARQHPSGSHITQLQAIQNNTVVPAVSNLVNLPKIDLPTFSGDYHNWLEFRDTFNSLIHSNIHISSIQKFHYLKASLKQKASNIIHSVDFSEANYELAWRTLLDRYDDKWLIIHNHIKAIFDLPSSNKENFIVLRQLHEDFTKHLHSLKVLGQPVDHWDTLLIYIISKKLDPISNREWEAYKYDSELPTIKDLKRFLKEKCILLEKLNESTTGPADKYKGNLKFEKVKGRATHSFVTTNQNSNSNVTLCAFCNEAHTIYQCEALQALPVPSRIAEIKKRRLCINCLRSNHQTMHCKSSKCRECGRKHNTLLHLINQPSNAITAPNETPAISAPEPGPSTTIVNHALSKHQQVLLSTAIIKVQDRSGQFHDCRALLDNGSQSNYITEELSNLLALPKDSINMTVTGINNAVSNLKNKVQLNIGSKHNACTYNISCIVIPKITENIPNISFDSSTLNIPENIKLADSTFNISSKVDLLIGVQIFYQLLCIGQIRLSQGQLILQKTQLGWVFAGSIAPPQNYPIRTSCNFSTIASNIDIQDQLAKFWRIEECSTTIPISREEKLCEEHFIATTTRDPEGRFVVSIPLKGSITNLGHSRDQAIRRFKSLEHKLSLNYKLKELYVKFMKEYETLGHMSKITNPNEPTIAFYLPHHGVLKEDSITTKLRVVFDGSAKSTSGVSINDLQMVGPVIQDNLFSILIRFRQHKYVVSSDIAKMYRQVCIRPQERSLQRIVWRENPSKPLEYYTLNTVTYGTSAASFLAIRALQQLGHESASLYPRSSAVIIKDFYVDDLLTGSDSIEELVRIRDEVTAILRQGCFELRKWVSNEPAVLHGVANSTDSSTLQLGPNEDTKTLGVVWLPKFDTISYSVNTANESFVTKRTILAATARIFDPLGLLAPSIIIPKVILQALWQYKLSWDESIPSDLHTRWLRFQNELYILQSINIPRHVMLHNAVVVEIHGFSDACESAYGACVYIRTIDVSGNILVRLLCAKSKVAPLSKLSIPRLELCGALLLTRLITSVRSAINKNFGRVTCWSDSTIALAWIKMSPSNLKTFVANRVSEIQDLTSDGDWCHVSSGDNPADLLSRGISPKKLINSKHWWEGPEWLSQPDSAWPSYDAGSCNLSEVNVESRVKSITLLTNNQDFNIFDRFSSFNKLRRCLAYILRFKLNCLTSVQYRKFKTLSIDELKHAVNTLIRLAQQEAFKQEIIDLSKGTSVHKKSDLFSLNPFLDEHGLIRVGGRLACSKFNRNKKHPILLPKNHRLTYLILEHEHRQLLHAGPQALLASVRENFWPISGRNAAKKTVHSCITCFRAKPKSYDPLMGSLPNDRVSPSPPFSICGVDYAGPILIKDRKGRGSKSTKAYICLFVCFATKAVHLELVSSLETETFLASLRRFISRRGKPNKIYSDNGTNFTGASSELKRFIGSLNNAPLFDSLATDGIAWHFIPPRSPHFGGLWEAGIKSVKFHLRRIVGTAILTYEELLTILTQIEAVLNSRPLSPLSTDPSDLSPLTPAHFLIGRSLIALPEPSLLDLKQSRLSRLQHVQQVTQHFWNRWSKEYLCELQKRVKWKESNQSYLKVGAMVILREDNLPPLKWHLGRITATHPGPDNIVRVVSVKCTSGIFKRAVGKICVLPINSI